MMEEFQEKELKLMLQLDQREELLVCALQYKDSDQLDDLSDWLSKRHPVVGSSSENPTDLLRKQLQEDGAICVKIGEVSLTGSL